MSHARRRASGSTGCYQQGCAKALLPRTHGGVPEGGARQHLGRVTGGDRLDWRADGRRRRGARRDDAGRRADLPLPPATSGVIETRLAARRRRARSTGCRRRRSSSRAAVSTGGSTSTWRPTRHAAAVETRRARPRGDGRGASARAITDQWRIRRGGRLVHAEALRPTATSRATAAGPATLGGARAFATLDPRRARRRGTGSTARARSSTRPSAGRAAASARPIS